MKVISDVIKKINKKILYLIIGVIVLIIIIICLFSGSNNENKYIPKGINQLELGEEKYLEFLWMVDGAFNNERYNNEFTVNGKKQENKSTFICKYEDKNKKTCIGSNFVDNFNKLFAVNVKVDKVYGDGASIKWYERLDNKDYFTNVNNCNAGRMSLNHTLKVINRKNNEITYQVTFDEEIKSGTYKGKHHFDKKFVLVYENSDWKVKEAYYHDPCYMEYNIK